MTKLSTTLLAIILSFVSMTKAIATDAGTPTEPTRQDSIASPSVKTQWKPRDYTQEEPLIYEDAQDLWPYSFLNEKGEPDGFNIDLMHLMLDKLNIPYKIRMRPRLVAFKDLKEGRSDLMIGLTAGFHEKVGHYGHNTVTLFTQSVLSPKSHPTNVHDFQDLSKHKVYVNDSSLCHHLMVDYGFAQNAIPVHNIGEVILQMSTSEEGEMVWNTLSLKWLLNKYHIDNLEITPVNMPHGDYRFISNDDHLLHQLDSLFTELNSTDQLEPLQNKWFYPERQEEGAIPEWLWYVIFGSGALLIILILYAVTYQIQASRITRENAIRTRRFALILETGGVRIWTYDISDRTFTWRNEQGLPAYVYTSEEFATRYSPEDYRRLRDAMDRLATLPPSADGVEEEITLDIKANDAREDGDTEMRDFTIALSVLRRDKHGRPSVLIGTKKDITEKRERQRLADERTLRYWAMFNTPIVGIMLFDQDGCIQNINPKACQMYRCEHDDIISCRMTYHNLLGIDDLDISQADGYHASAIIDPERMAEEQRANCPCKLREKLYIEFRLMTVFDETDKLLGMFAICQEVSHVAQSLKKQTAIQQHLQEMTTQEGEYVDAINDFIHNGNVRLVTYSPTSHTFTVFDGNDHVQHSLTQTRIMTLVEDRMRTKVMHVLDRMDDAENAEIELDVRTTLRVSGRWLHLYIHLLPQLDTNGQVKEYVGVLRDISELRSIEQQLAQVEAKTQEVEDTKSSFVKNMMQEIQTPMNTVIDCANQLQPNGPSGGEPELTNTIIENAEQLTHIIGNILNLSRIEAHMVEIIKRPVDFAKVFETYCDEGWAKHTVPEVRYIIENPYKQLVLDIDIDHLGNIIKQVVMNAAQHTRNGVIRARYDYIGRRLMISVEDTGEGMTAQQLEELTGQLESGTHTSSGLGLPICKELLKQMGGSLEISSECGIGTTVWITLPCAATNIKRKKIQ
ncbi:MAG: transporter substrate-binding domain-containing protein [Prevotella sp.]|nr:transporter substrate-binding domain-containing protein [Prevotella sp.]